MMYCLKNSMFAEYLEFIYPSELEIMETTETATSASYLDCYLYNDNGKLATRLYDNGMFSFFLFPFLCRIIPSRKYLRTKATPDFHLTYSKNGGNLRSVSK